MKQGFAQLAGQLLNIWKQLGLNQRITVGLATGAVLLGLAALGVFSTRVSYGLLYGGLDEAEASRVSAALDEAKIPYQVRGPGSIYVPSDQVYSARMQLAGKGIPRGEGVGFEIFDKPNFGISDFVQRANFKRAIEGELSRTISQLDAIETARVQVVIPENRLLNDSTKKPTASVLVRVRGNAPLPPAAVSSIRFLVANAVEGLAAGNVAVIDHMGNVLSENDGDNSLGALSSVQLRAQRDYEQYLSRKAEGMLSAVLGGPGQAVVRVAADLNWDTMTKYEEKYDPEGQVVRTSTINDEQLQTTSASNGGAPGVASNTAIDPSNTVASATGPPVTTSKTSKKLTTSNYDVNRTVSSFLQNAGGIRRLSAAVLLAQRFEGTGTARKPVPRTPEELQNLRQLVQNALGIREGDATRSDQITLVETPFNEEPALELVRQLDQQERRQFWMDLGHKLLYPALGLVVVFLFWRALQRARTDDLTAGIPYELLSGNGHGSNGGNGHAPGQEPAVPGRPHRRGDPKIVTVEVLNQLIRENPANMTQAVRTWLTRTKPAK